MSAQKYWKDKFDSKLDFFATVALMLFGSFMSFMVYPSTLRNPPRSSVALGVVLLMVCLYRIIKHVFSFLVRLNIAKRLILISIVHMTPFLFYNYSSIHFGDALTIRYASGVIISFSTTVILELVSLSNSK